MYTFPRFSPLDLDVRSKRATVIALHLVATTLHFVTNCMLTSSGIGGRLLEKLTQMVRWIHSCSNINEILTKFAPNWW